MLVNLEGTIDHAIFRAIAKIAFNYLAYWQGADFVQHPDFGKARRYIRWGHFPGFKTIQVDNTAILEREPVSTPLGCDPESEARWYGTPGVGD